MIGDLLSGLAHANLALAAAVVAVALARKPVRRAFGARAAYALWIVVPLAAAAVLAPRPQAPTLLSPVAVSVTDVFVAAPVVVSRGFDPAPWLFGLWAAGALAAAGLLAVRQGRFMAEVRAGRAGPAVIGALRPRIVTPADFQARFGPDEQAVILSHEDVHLRNGDARVNALAAAAQCLCWFNPLVHLAAHLMRIDQELACDAAVLGRHPQARRLYAEALLKTQLTTQPLPLGCHWPSAAEHPLKERILMLKSPLPAPARRLAGLAVVAVAAAGVAVAAWAAQPGLEPDAAQKLVRPGQEVECKPDANRELHNCAVVATPWAKIATAADVVAAFPKYELARGLTADVLLQCAPAGDRLAGCKARKVYPDQPLPKGSEAAFEAAAVQVAGVYRIKPDAKLPNPSFMTIQFRAEPAMPGGPVTGPMPRRAPAELPMPHFRPAEAATIANPVWLEKPTGADIARLYPAEAASRGISADVVLTCHVGADGRMAECRGSHSEARGPAGRAPEADMDFGSATLQLAKLFRMDMTGQAAGGVVRIPVRWLPPASTPPGAQAAAANPMIAAPKWIEKPTLEDVRRLYPAAARQLTRDMQVRATLTCAVADNGRLRDCAISGMSGTAQQMTIPKGYDGGDFFGFRPATLELSKLFRMDTLSRDGVKTAGGTVQIPVVWIPPSAS